MGCIAAGLLLLLTPIAAYTFWSMVPPLPLRTFDSSEWRAVTRSDDYARQEMVGSLIWNGALEGLSREEVLALLGPDCECGYFKDWDFVYWLGPERSWISLDSAWLVIDFNDEGRYERYALVTD